MRRSLPLWFACLLFACSSDSDTPGGDVDGGGSDAPPNGPGTYTVTFGPHPVPAFSEDTQCVEKKLGNVDAVLIDALETHLNAVSHHLIVYRVPGTEERAEPYPCFPFVDTVRPQSESSPLMVSQIDDETLQLPDGVAFRLKADQMVRLEMHYVNATETEMDVSASATFHVLPPEEFEQEADFLFTGNLDVQVPPGPSTLGPTWFPLPPELQDVKIFGMTGHTHQWGTNVEVEQRDSRDEPGEMVYQYAEWNWEEPPVAQYQPPLDMPAGAGFRFSCSWDNQSGQTVGLGESAEDEMCFFWSYYYPSVGHRVCIHTDQYDDNVGEPGTDVCCPGSPFCAFIDQIF